MKSIKKFGFTIFALLAIVLAQIVSPKNVGAACGGIVYVDANSTAVSPTGCNWASAYKYLQDALADPLLTSGDQIWVAQGTYYPDEGGANTNNDRYSSFRLVEGVEIYGGFSGTETSLVQRNSNPATNNTVLSGDIDGTPDDTVNNAHHVVFTDAITAASILDGFTITGGNTDGDGHFGGGAYVINASPTLRNLVITANQSPTGGGGGMFIGTDPGETTSSPLLTNITFSNNIAERGGGLFNQNSDPVLTNVIFNGNSATNGAGGGMNSQTATNDDPPSNPVLNNVTFFANTATGGGGMINSNSHAVMTNVTFSGNAVGRRGGGLLNEGSNPELTNVTFYNNTSIDDTLYADPRGGGGMMNIASDPILNNVTFSANNSVLIGGDAMRNVALDGISSDPQIRNSIFWNDANDEILNDATSTVTISDSVVEDGIAGTNIIAADPKLGPLASNGGFTQTMALGVGSSAVNQGGTVIACATMDQRGVMRPQGAACDIGAYEFDGATILTAASATGTYGGTVNLSAAITSYGTGLDGKTINFTLNGSNVGSAVTNSSGVATLTSISLAGINASTYPASVGASFAGDSIFVAGSDTDALTVEPRPITVTAATDTKVYDGTADSTGIPSITLGDLVSGDTASWTQSFEDKIAGTNKTIIPAGTVSDDNGGNNYSITFRAVSTGVITAKPLTVSGVTAASKTYDGNTTAALNTASVSLVGIVSGDSVSLGTGSATGAFADKNVGTGKTVFVSGLTLGGIDAPNYFLTQPTAVADITKRPLTVTATGVDKEYDGTAIATVVFYDDRILGDVLSVTYSTASFLDPNIGIGKTINVNDIAISGADAGNYALTNTTATTTANITQANQTITITTHAPASAANGSIFTVAATASSGLPVAYNSATPGVCTNSGATFTMISGTNTCIVQYNQAGDSNHLPAPELTESVIATEAPVITSTDNTTFNVGEFGSFTVTAIGNPGPSLSISGTLPTGVTFNPATGVLSGTPAIGTGGTYNLTFTASNGAGPDAVQNFVLTITSIAKINVTISGNSMGSYTLLPGEEKRETYPVSGGPVKVDATNGMNIIAAIRLQSYVNNTLLDYNETMGIPQGSLSTKYYFPVYENKWAPLNSQIRFAHLGMGTKTIKVTIGSESWTYDVAEGQDRRIFLDRSGGPVIVESLDGVTQIIAAIRLQGMANNLLNFYNETMGIPVEALSTKYFFPVYENKWAPLNSQIRFAHLGTGTKTIKVTIGTESWTYDVAEGQDRRISLDRSGGPVIVESLDGVTKIIAAIRLQSFANNTLLDYNETMGIPEGSLSTRYIFPVYENKWAPLNSQIRFAHLGTGTKTIKVTIGSESWTYDVAEGQDMRIFLDRSGGPVIVESLDGVTNIIAAIRLQGMANNLLNHYSETMGIPVESLSTTYYFPVYENLWAPLNSQVRFGVP